MTDFCDDSGGVFSVHEALPFTYCFLQKPLGRRIPPKCFNSTAAGVDGAEAAKVRGQDGCRMLLTNPPL